MRLNRMTNPLSWLKGKHFMLSTRRSLILGFALLLLAGASAVHAQGLKPEFFLQPEARFSRIGDGTAVVSGFNTGWIFGKKLMIGGTSFSTNYGIEPNMTLATGDSKAEFRYRGGMIGWQFKSMGIVKPSISTVIGRGKLTSLGTTAGASGTVLADRFWVFEPMANLNIKVTKWGSLSLGGGYRFTTGGEYNGFDKNDLRSPTARIGFTLGSW